MDDDNRDDADIVDAREDEDNNEDDIDEMVVDKRGIAREFGARVRIFDHDEETDTSGVNLETPSAVTAST